MKEPDHRRARRVLIAVAAAVIALDAGSKALALHFLGGGTSVRVLGGLAHLELYRNFAGPGNSLRGHPVLVSALALTAVLVIAVLASRVRTVTAAVAAGLLLGAGIGNLLDRLLRAPGPLRGGVIDWLRPAWSHGTMNLADLAINVALVMLAVGAATAWWRARAARDAEGVVGTGGHRQSSP